MFCTLYINWLNIVFLQSGAYEGAHIHNLSTLVVWKCVYDRIVYILKKVLIFFSKKYFLKMLPRGGAQKCAPPYTNSLARPCLQFFILQYYNTYAIMVCFIFTNFFLFLNHVYWNFFLLCWFRFFPCLLIICKVF